MQFRHKTDGHWHRSISARCITSRANKLTVTVAFKQSSWVLFFECEKLAGSSTNLRQNILHPPHFTFVAQTKFTDQLQFLVQAFLFKRTPGCWVGFLWVERYTRHFVADSLPASNIIIVNKNTHIYAYTMVMIRAVLTFSRLPDCVVGF